MYDSLEWKMIELHPFEVESQQSPFWEKSSYYY